MPNPTGKWTPELKQKLVDIQDDIKLKQKFPRLSLESARRLQRKFRDEGFIAGWTENTKPENIVAYEVAQAKYSNVVRESDKKTKALVSRIAELEDTLAELTGVEQTPQTFTIKPSATAEFSESTAFMIWSDWHIEELIKSATVNGINEFNLDIAEQRIRNLCVNGVKLLQTCRTSTKIDELVIGLLGDFISGNIHEELLENTCLEPGKAIIQAEEFIAGAIQYILDSTDLKKIRIVCCDGNHSRITKKIHYSTQQGNSLEYLLFHMLRNRFKGESRVEFLISEGYHAYIQVYDKKVRLHHGHYIRFNGGMGGIFTPVYKAIQSWNKTQHADLDIFGHMHTQNDGNSFLSNGSLCGFGTFALALKIPYDEPKQLFFLINKNHGKSIVAPIWVK